MKILNKPGTLLALFLLIGACSPKVGQEISTTPAETQPAQPTPTETSDEPKSCQTFADLGSSTNQIKEYYVLYRDFLREENWDEAYKYWLRVYAAAPAADGKRNTVYADGIRFYQQFMSQTQDSLKKEEYVDKIFGLYDQIEECYPEGGYISARKAFDYYYEYPERASRMEIYQLFKAAIDKDGLETPDFAINPFAALLVELYFDDKIPMAEAQEYQQKIRDIIAKGKEDCAENNTCHRWETIESYAPTRLEAFETVRGFYDCDYYMEKYYEEFEAAPQDCDNLRTVYSRLKWGGCQETQEKFAALIEAGNENCRTTTVNVNLKTAYDCLQNADYECAVENFEKEVLETDDTDKQAQYLLVIAKIYNAHLKNFSRAREYALKAAEAKPNWGEPYILIGRLYASSGPLCGPGRGWDSQIVVWTAIDAWNRAKSVDPDAAAEANKWIGRYAQYMPNKEDVFIRNLKAGQSFYVGCWIQRNTVIRTSD